MKKNSDPDNNPEKKLAGYSGRWVAKLWGRIVGQGGTPEQASKAAQAARHKEISTVNYVPTESPLTFSPLLQKIQSAIPNKKEIYLVGGAVRDALLKVQSQDLDFTLPKNALSTARKIANALEGAYYKLDDEYETGRVILSDENGQRISLDFSVFRGDDLENDLRGRDFTINAMAVNIHHSQQLLDPLGGVADLFKKKLRVCSSTSILDDPVRIIRAIRFAGKYKLKINDETKELIKESTHLLDNVSPERVRDEMFKLLSTQRPDTSIRALDMLGGLKYILPELVAIKGIDQSPPYESDVWTHTLRTVRQVEEILRVLSLEFKTGREGEDLGEKGNLVYGLLSLQLGRYRKQINEHFNESINVERPFLPLFYFAALYCHVGTVETLNMNDGNARAMPNHQKSSANLGVSRGASFRLSNAEIDRVERIIRYFDLHAKLINPVTDLDIYHYFKTTGKAGIDITLLSLADLLACFGSALSIDKLESQIEIVKALLEGYYEKYDQVIKPPQLLDGADLMKALKLKQGPRIGELLEVIREAQVSGEVTSKDEALTLAISLMDS